MGDRDQQTRQMRQEIQALRAQVAALEAERTAGEQTREADRLYRSMVDQSLGLLGAHDFEGNCLYANPALTQALGYPPQAWIGRNVCDFLAPSFQSLFDEYLQRIRKHREADGLVRVMTKTGEARIWRYHNVWYERTGSHAILSELPKM